MPDCYVQYTIKNTDNTIQKQPAAESAAGNLSIVQDTVTDAVSLHPEYLLPPFTVK